MRTFIAFDLPDDVKRIVATLQDPLRSVRGVKLTRPEQCHLTLKFLGEIDASACADCCAALRKVRQSPLRLSLTGLGAFPDAQHPRVLWLGVSDTAALADLAGAVDRATAAVALDRPFAPHITLARLVRGGARLDAGLLTSPVPPCTFAVTEFLLYSSVLASSGSKYDVLGRFALGE